VDLDKHGEYKSPYALEVDRVLEAVDRPLFRSVTSRFRHREGAATLVPLSPDEVNKITQFSFRDVPIIPRSDNAKSVFCDEHELGRLV
jgi:hypothetical protein